MLIKNEQIIVLVGITIMIGIIYWMSTRDDETTHKDKDS